MHETPRLGRPFEVTEGYRAVLLAAVRRRPRRWGLIFSRWTFPRLVDDLLEPTRIRVSEETVRSTLTPTGMVRSRLQPQINRPAPNDHGEQ
jgi:hypothetical protein